MLKRSSVFEAPLYQNILTFGLDSDLLLPEDSNNEAQNRHREYCIWMNQKRVFIILCRSCVSQSRSLFNARILSIAACSRFFIFQLIKALVNGAKATWKLSPDLIEYQDPQVTGPIAFLISKAFRKPLVGGVFSDIYLNKERPGNRLFGVISLIVAEYIIRHSWRVRCDALDKTQELQKKNDNVMFVPFYISLKRRFSVTQEDLRARMDQWREDPVILCVARMAEEKNLPLLLNSFSVAYKKHCRGHLIVVGDGVLKTHLQDLAAELLIDQAVTWAGTIPYVDLPPYYRRANIFALSSDFETSPRALILSRVARLPAITTDTSGCRQIIKHGVTGFVIKKGNSIGFASALGELIADEKKYCKMLFHIEFDEHDGESNRLTKEALIRFYSK